MTDLKLPPSVRSALLDFQQFWFKGLPDEVIPLEFWKIGNDEAARFDFPTGSNV